MYEEHEIRYAIDHIHGDHTGPDDRADGGIHLEHGQRKKRIRRDSERSGGDYRRGADQFRGGQLHRPADPGHGAFRV